MCSSSRPLTKMPPPTAQVRRRRPWSRKWRFTSKLQVRGGLQAQVGVSKRMGRRVQVMHAQIRPLVHAQEEVDTRRREQAKALAGAGLDEVVVILLVDVGGGAPFDDELPRHRSSDEVAGGRARSHNADDVVVVAADVDALSVHFEAWAPLEARAVGGRLGAAGGFGEEIGAGAPVERQPPSPIVEQVDRRAHLRKKTNAPAPQPQARAASQKRIVVSENDWTRIDDVGGRSGLTCRLCVKIEREVDLEGGPTEGPHSEGGDHRLVLRGATRTTPTKGVDIEVARGRA